MKLIILLSSLLGLLLITDNVSSGPTFPNAPSGIAYNGCGLFKCSAKHYYLPGKGVWAPEPKFKGKSRIGAVFGSVLMSIVTSGSDPLISAAATGAGLLVGYGVGSHLDKVDELYASMVMEHSLNNNVKGQTTSWNHPEKPLSIDITPTSDNGRCRNFETIIDAGGQQKHMRGLACKESGEWNLKKVY